MAALVDLIIDVVGQLLIGWLPERRWLRRLVLGVYFALFATAVVWAVQSLS